MAVFRLAHEPLHGFEGGYSHHPDDTGKETFAGISRMHNPDLPLWMLIDAAKTHPSFKQGAPAFSLHLWQTSGIGEEVQAFYESLFNGLGLSADDMPQALANEIYEQVVNLGHNGHTRYLQRICNAFNRDKRTGKALFAELRVDGALGNKTTTALRTLLAKRTTQNDIVHVLNAAQAMHYINIAAEKPSQRAFLDGWLKRTYAKEA